MKYHEASLLKTAANETQWPESELPEIVFAGRSNAGKSTLINALVNRKNLAYSGKTPGKTRLLNFFIVDKSIVFTDAPGYGYATRDDASALAFDRLISPYFEKRNQLKAMILVLDARRDPSNDDLTMLEYARDVHLPILIVLTKSDKLSRGAMLNNRMKIAKSLNVSTNAIIPVDSLKKVGMDDVWDKIFETIQQG